MDMFMYEDENWFMYESTERIRKMLNEVADSIERDRKVNDRLAIENQRLKSERYKDEELAKMEKELEEDRELMSRSFLVSENAQKKIDDFRNKHYKKHGDRTYFTYEFEPTGIGTAGTIVCKVCGKSECFQELG